MKVQWNTEMCASCSIFDTVDKNVEQILRIKATKMFTLLFHGKKQQCFKSVRTYLQHCSSISFNAHTTFCRFPIVLIMVTMYYSLIFVNLRGAAASRGNDDESRIGRGAS